MGDGEEAEQAWGRCNTESGWGVLLLITRRPHFVKKMTICTGRHEIGLTIID